MFLPSNITLKFGDSGDFVAELQRRLALVRCFSEDQVNGYYDGTTVNAVTSFQSREGLHADGVAGPETLRRLNGVIAGDTTSSAEDKKEEEAKALEAQRIRHDIMQMAPQAVDPLAYAAPAHAPYGEEAYQQPGAAAPINPVVTPETLPPSHPVPAMSEQQRMNEMAARDAMHQPAPAPSSAAETLNQMLRQAETNMAAQPAPAPKAAELPPAAPVREAPPVPKEMPVEKPLAEPAAAAAAPAAEPKGIVGRAMSAAGSMLQKLADYFEAKLPPSVLNEVKAIGMVMAQSGMKEAPIPTGPEMPTRAPELPTRGPEQGQQR